MSYGSDQSVVQRYMTTPSRRKAASAIWTNASMCIPASMIFFAVGTALFVFYKSHPARLEPTFKTDAVFALFISREMPWGIAGLVVAGIFAAAQSTLSTSLNSLSTAIVTDFARPFDLCKSEKGYLNLARWVTVLLGVSGTVIAIMFELGDIKSLFDEFMSILGMFGGALSGLFMLGMFTTRGSAAGGLIGAIAATAFVWYVKYFTPTNFFIYAAIGNVTCFAVGYLMSMLLPSKPADLQGLTIYTMGDAEVKEG